LNSCLFKKKKKKLEVERESELVHFENKRVEGLLRRRNI